MAREETHPTRFEWQIEAGQAGIRLDRFLGDSLNLSRRQVRLLFRSGQVTLDEIRQTEASKGVPLQAGMRVCVSGYQAPADQRARAPETFTLDLLAEGPGWVAAFKPEGIPVHPLVPEESETLAGAVLERFPSMHGVGEGGLRSGVLHRIDVPTSGIVLFATGQEQWERIRQAFRSHRIDKRYQALVEGPLPGCGEEEVWLRVARHHPAKVEVVSVSGSRSEDSSARRTRLSWRALEEVGRDQWLEIQLETGFLHQIRATFAARGHPLVGDPEYGGAAETRLMLHASAVAFEEIRVDCPCPPSFKEVIERRKLIEFN